MTDPIAESAACIANGSPPPDDLRPGTIVYGPPQLLEALSAPSIGSLIHDAVDRVVASGVIEQTLDASITNAIVKSLQDMTSPYSEFGKALKQQLATALECGPSLDLPTYGHLVLQIVRRQVDAAMGQQLQAQIEKTMAELLASPPQSIKLTELVAAFIEHHHEHRSDRNSSQITLLVSRPESFGYRAICLDPESGVEQYRCLIRIATDENGRVYSLSLRDHDFEKRLFCGPLYCFERLLFQLHANKVPIVFDAEPSDIDTFYPESDE